MLFPIGCQGFPVGRAEEDAAHVVQQVRFTFAAFVQHNIVHGKYLAFPVYVGTYVDAFPLKVQRGLETVFRTIFQVLAVIAFLLHLKRVGIGVLQGIAFLVVGIPRFGIYISQVIEQLGVFVEGVHAVGADFHSINLCFGHVVELCPDAETLAVLQHLYGVCNAVYHAQVRIVE